MHTGKITTYTIYGGVIGGMVGFGTTTTLYKKVIDNLSEQFQYVKDKYPQNHAGNNFIIDNFYNVIEEASATAEYCLIDIIVVPLAVAGCALTTVVSTVAMSAIGATCGAAIGILHDYAT